MTAIPADPHASIQDFQELSNLVAGIKADELINKLQNMATEKKGRLKFGQKATKKSQHDSLTIRFTPETQKKWQKTLSQIAEDKTHTSKDVQKRISKRFTKALTKGEVIIEVMSQGKRKAYASQATVKKLRDGSISLGSPNGKIKKYDDIKVIQNDIFIQLATVFVNTFKQQLPAQANVSSNAITSLQGTLLPLIITIPDIQIQTPSKSVTLKANRESKPHTDKELEKLNQKGIEAERKALQRRKNIHKKVLKREEKNKVETTKKQTLNTEKKTEAEQLQQKDRAYTLRKSRLSRSRS